MATINHGGLLAAPNLKVGYPLADIGFTCDSAPLARQQCLAFDQIKGSVAAGTAGAPADNKKVVRPISIPVQARDGMTRQIRFDLTVGWATPSQR
jgi:hypothetical protein